VSNHPHYRRWRGIITRCYNPASTAYKNYGGRGIKVDELWLQQPALFLRYLDEVLGPCPAGHSIDRIDPDGDYEPGNIRWASAFVQTHNKTKRVVFRGELVDPDARYGCSFCPEIFTSESAFKAHMRGHRRG
jgi:hypothetical protein